MLQNNRIETLPDTHKGFDAGSLVETFRSFMRLVRRQFPLFVLVPLGCLCIGIGYLATTPATYTALATMMLDTRKVQQFQQQAATSDQPVDAATVQSQVELLKSKNIGTAVVKNLRLMDDPEFVPTRSGPLGFIARLLGHPGIDPASLPEGIRLSIALGYFNANRIVARVGQTYAMDVGFQSTDPDKAARIANAIVDAYITDQLDAKFQSTKRASLWLQDRINELQTQAGAADRAVVDFKAANNIVNADGRLVNEQQVSEVNSQLTTAHAATAEAKARLDRITEVMKQPVPDASMTDALKSEIIIQLRRQYLELASRESIFSTRYGANHQATANLRTQMNELTRNISSEMQKITQSYQSEYMIAQAREDALRGSLKTSVSDTQATNQAQVELRELLSKAQSYRSLYDNFLQRYMDAVQQQSFPTTEARLISPAERPGGRSKPSLVGVIGAAIAGGALLGFGLAVLREMADRVFRSGAQVADTLRLTCIATVPLVKESKPGVVRAEPRREREIVLGPGLWRHVVDHPFSAFAESLRSIKIAVDLAAAGRTGMVLGITSTLPNEGKSTISANFAALISHAGGRVLLVDADLRNSSLSRILAPEAESGLVNLINGQGALDKLIWTDATSNLSFLPAGAGPKLMHTNEMLGSDRIRAFFTAARAHYDYIIVDLAPLAPVVDTRATVHFIDSYIYAVEWGSTKIDVVEDVLSDAREVYDNILGMVLNKADLAVLGRYERHRGQNYYRKYYSRYGYTS